MRKKKTEDVQIKKPVKKKVTEKKPRKKHIPKVKPLLPRAGGTMSEAQFWNMIKAALRNRSRFWKPIYQTRDDAKRKYDGTNKRMKYVYECSLCHSLVKITEGAVHHLVDVGSLSCYTDLPGFVERLFCECSGLVFLCKDCHLKIHQETDCENCHSKKQVI